MITIACFNSYMGKKESWLTQLWDTIGFLFQRPRLIYRSKRNIIETLSLLQQKKAFNCDYLYITEILPEDQEKVDMLLETRGYKQWVRWKSWSKTPLSSVLATKHESSSIALPEHFVEPSRGYGGFICDNNKLPIIWVHFAVTKVEQQKMRKEILPLIVSLVSDYKSMILVWDLNQGYKTVRKLLHGKWLSIQGTTAATHKIIGWKRTKRNLDNILMISKVGQQPQYRLLKHKLYRWRSDHALIVTTLQKADARSIRFERQSKVKK